MNRFPDWSAYCPSSRRNSQTSQELFTLSLSIQAKLAGNIEDGVFEREGTRHRGQVETSTHSNVLLKTDFPEICKL
ncbi:hypothetical protein AcW1_007533 [Taiwanofungus camphoratus]|nr:hypothetical protein AcV7_009732 [Antrodia cinnamomea]KAI0953274.1 hypothetical protein AcW1_007533 [Antrodia cinnamomea]